MHSHSLTLPLLPGLSLRPAGVAPSRRWFRLPRILSQTARGATQPGDLSAHRIERRLRKSARRGQRIVLGTAEQPYEPLAAGLAPLAVLRRFDGLPIVITTGSSEILEQLDLLIELDRRHTVALEILIASLEPGSADLAERLRTVAALSSHGITTRLVLTDLPRLPLSGAAASGIRRLFEAARDCRAFDVAAAIESCVEIEEWSRLLRHLRLELGFPRSVPGRG